MGYGPFMGTFNQNARPALWAAGIAVAAAATLLATFTHAADTTTSSKSAYTVGQTAPAFKTKTVDGKTLSFPADYKGKIVLLDFWATWCAPCRAELPNVVSAYQQYHPKGLEILSISLDQPRQGPQVLKFVQDNNMSWPQIYDGKFWKADLALEYGIHSIPRPILVDGDTGVIIAEGPGARGTRLAPAIEQGLAAKAKK